MDLLVVITAELKTLYEILKICFIVVFDIADWRDPEGSHPYTICEMTPLTDRDFK